AGVTGASLARTGVGLARAGRSAGIGARLLRAAAAPSTLAMRAGQAAELGAGALIRGGARSTALRRVLGRAAETAIGGAVEGGIQGAGQVVSEAALGNEELTAESVIAGIGMGALLGGGGTGLFGGGTALLGEAARGGARLARSGQDIVARAWQSRTGRELAPGVGE